MAHAFTTTALDDLGREVPVSEVECPLCQWPIASREVFCLGGETYCRSHSGLAAVSVIEDSLSGDEVPPRVLRDAHEILRILIARSGGSPSGEREG